MHFGNEKVNRYIIEEKPILVVRSHKRLEMKVSHDLKTMAYYREVAAKGFKTETYQVRYYHAYYSIHDLSKN